ncbi:hypothetical protein V5N11_010736 [Cardamine amara subsp. amara]|uniref:EF-hand domain-containing protein n=1 Tax=Cardamine amara subsp. amara TaxID=228776 RepID=A0ABD1ACV6_CARAN
MDELHEAAQAYYNNCTPEQQRLAWEFFKAMDVDGDGRVSLQEYSHFLCQTSGLAWVHPEMFRELDRDRDGQLDFWEVLTLYYVARTRTISCRHCRRHRWYNHQHCLFLDSYVLLRSRRSQDSQLQPLGDQNLAGEEPSTVGIVWWSAYRAMEMALLVGSLGTFCTIM